jgi:hypothetical protein
MAITTKPCEASLGPSQATLDRDAVKPGETAMPRASGIDARR